LAWLPSSLLILLYLLSTPKQAGQAASEKPLCFCGKTRAVGHYSQAESGTQGKIAKKAGKMQIFGEALVNNAQECRFQRFAGKNFRD
jgi:hypothetical protein